MPRYRRFGQGPARHKSPLMSVIWLIGMAVLIYSHNIWPGILILIGISVVLSASWKNGQQGEFAEPSQSPAPSQDRVWEEPRPEVIVQPPTPPVGHNPIPRNNLPATCPHCGAPVRSNEIKWSGSQASCSYCGSTLPAASKL